jgi:tetratricopeptide (TPR) repeat protein
LTRSVAHLSLAVTLLSVSCSTPFPRPGPGENAADAWVYYNRGETLFDDIVATDPINGDYGKAIAEFNRAIRLKPDYVEAYHARGIVYYIAGNRARAIEDYGEAIRLNPKNTLSYILRGMAYESEHQFEIAIKDYNRLIDLDPEYGPAWCYRGLAYKHLGNEGMAEADMEKARKLGCQCRTEPEQPENWLSGQWDGDPYIIGSQRY